MVGCPKVANKRGRKELMMYGFNACMKDKMSRHLSLSVICRFAEFDIKRRPLCRICHKKICTLGAISSLNPMK